MIRPLRALARRLLGVGAVVVGTVVLTQVLVVLAPGSAAGQAGVDSAQRDALARAWGEDQRPAVQVARGAWATLTGDLGESRVVRPGAPVRDLASTAWVASTPRLLGALALCLGLGAGLAASGRRPGVGAEALSAAPVFLVAAIVVEGANAGTWALMQRGWVERPSWFALPDQAGWLREGLAVLILAVASGALAETWRDCAAAWDTAQRSPWADAARARGEPLAGHLATNLVAPLSRVAAGRVLLLVGGLVVLEKMLLLQGAGSLLWRAAQERDAPLAAGLALVGALWVAVVAGLGAAAAAWADPRLRAR